MQTTEYVVVQQDFGPWRVTRTSDRAFAARHSGGKGGADVREWRTRDGAEQFVDRLIKRQPIATMHLAWITSAEGSAGEGAARPQVRSASASTTALAGVWTTDFYKGGA